MPIKLGIVMDPIESIHIKKDSTFAMMLGAQKRGWILHYMQANDIWLQDGKTFARTKQLHVIDHSEHWFDIQSSTEFALHELDIILMRKDPPFNAEYVYITQLLEIAERHGALVVNKPQSLRDANEKLFSQWFPQCTPPSCVTSNQQKIIQFLQQYQDIILKPLSGMGGEGIFRIREHDANLYAIIETVTQNGQSYAMAQCYIPEITQGDKRILMIDGEPAPYALARIPKADETRANLAAGGRGVAQPLTKHDQWICEQVAPILKEKELLFVGLDVIGNYLTEINVTSPTCIRELEPYCDHSIVERFLNCLEKKLVSR